MDMSQYHSEPNKNVCRESHDRIMTYVPKSTNNPSTPQNANDTGDEDTHMHDVTAEEEKKHAPRQCTSDQKDARAEYNSAISQPSESKQHVCSKKHVTWAN